MAISYPEMEADEALDEAFDEADEAEPWEAGRRGAGRGRAVTTAPGSTAYQRPTSNGYVTQRQLQDALKQVANQVATNSKAITQVNARVNSLGTEQSRQMATLRKETGERRKQSDALSGAIRQLRDAEEVIPLISGTGAQGSTLGAILPLLLLSGIQVPTSETSGAPAQSGGLFGSGGDSNTMLILALALSGGLGGRPGGTT